jgi:hypothetical protein
VIRLRLWNMSCSSDAGSWVSPFSTSGLLLPHATLGDGGPGVSWRQTAREATLHCKAFCKKRKQSCGRYYALMLIVASRHEALQKWRSPSVSQHHTVTEQTRSTHNIQVSKHTDRRCALKTRLTLSVSTINISTRKRRVSRQHLDGARRRNAAAQL